LRSARQRLGSAQAASQATAARTERKVDDAAASFAAAQGSLDTTLAANTTYLDAPTAADLEVAET
jgi:hypothetical protein